MERRHCFEAGLLWEPAELLWSQGDYRRAKDLAKRRSRSWIGSGRRRWMRSRPATRWPLRSTTLATRRGQASFLNCRRHWRVRPAMISRSRPPSAALEIRSSKRTLPLPRTSTSRGGRSDCTATASKNRSSPTRWWTSDSSRSRETAVEEAAAQFQASFSICRAERATHTLVWAVEGLAAVALARDEPAVATRLLAATGSLRTEIGFAERYYTIGNEVRDRTLESARQSSSGRRSSQKRWPTAGRCRSTRWPTPPRSSLESSLRPTG